TIVASDATTKSPSFQWLVAVVATSGQPTVEEGADPRVGASIPKFARPPACNDAARVAIDQYALADDGEDARELVGYEHGRHAHAAIQGQDQVVQLHRADRIEPGRRLVEEQERRIERECARDASALLHATGYLGGHVVLEAFEPDEPELRSHDDVDRPRIEV